MEDLCYDVAVVGGGPGGYSAAVKASQLGAKVVLFEKGELGGTCLNVGCIPTKSLLEQAALMEKIKKNTLSGIFKDAGLYSWKKIQQQKDQTVKTLTGGVRTILSSYGVTVVKAAATVKGPDCVQADGKSYQAKKLILATGSKACIPPIPGADGEKVITSTQALSLSKVPKHLIVIGGGVIGQEFASIYRTFGSQITVIEMMDDILMGEDREMVGHLKKELNKREIRLLTGAKVEQISDRNGQKVVTCTKNGAREEVVGDCVLLAAGRQPNTEGIELEGLERDRRGNIVVNAYMETSVPNVYAVGDAAGGFQLAHAAYAEAEAAAENCMGGHRQADLKVMPRCIFCIPQYGAVGQTEEQLKAQGIAYEKSLYPYVMNGKALASGETSGMAKVLVSTEEKRVLGVHIMGGYATELLSSAIVGIAQGMTVDDFERVIMPHPTMSELVREAVLDVEHRAIHKPKAK